MVNIQAKILIFKCLFHKKHIILKEEYISKFKIGVIDEI